MPDWELAKSPHYGASYSARGACGSPHANPDSGPAVRLLNSGVLMTWHHVQPGPGALHPSL